MKLELYHRKSCPYSKKVRDFIDQNNLKSKVTFLEVDDIPHSTQTLLQLNGKVTVPCLVINGEPLLESDEIISWMDSNLLSENRMAQ